MKAPIHYLSALLLISIIACQPSKKEEKSPEVKTETPAETSETKATNETVTVLNANLATKEELADTDLSDSLVSQVISQRPFITLNDFNALLTNLDSASKATLYTQVFVPLNLNTTPEEDFKMIPGVGKRMALEFEEYRPYTKPEQFRKEIGKYVDEAEVTRYLQYAFVPIELNTASEEDILALPGVGKRMAHEFEEYRPYESMEQFRKEIGKYVDDKELLRLERLVYLAK